MQKHSAFVGAVFAAHEKMRKEGLSQWVVHEFVFSEEVASKKQAARYNIISIVLR